MKKFIFIFYLMTTKLTFGQINGGFEIWDTTYVNLYSSNLTNVFAVPNPYGGVANHWVNGSGFGISQTTDSYSGNYSLILHNWYNYAQEWITYHDTLNYRPQYLQGYFKYITGGIDGLSQGELKITLTRFDGTANDTIATGAYTFDSTTTFTSFQVSLNYISTLIPDSINIYIINANSNCIQNVICNLLYLDNLTLSNSPSGITNLNTSEDVVSVFPNPSGNELNIQINSTQIFQFTLYNSLGEKIIDKNLKSKTSTIDLSVYSNDIYFYKLSSADKHLIKSGKLIKQ